MSLSKATLTEVSKVAQEVLILIDLTIDEINGRRSWERDGNGQHLPMYPNETAPGHATPDGSKTTAALKRRSMDLTRLLAELRRSN